MKRVEGFEKTRLTREVWGYWLERNREAMIWREMTPTEVSFDSRTKREKLGLQGGFGRRRFGLFWWKCNWAGFEKYVKYQQDVLSQPSKPSKDYFLCAAEFVELPLKVLVPFTVWPFETSRLKGENMMVHDNDWKESNSVWHKGLWILQHFMIERILRRGDKAWWRRQFRSFWVFLENRSCL